MGGRGDCGAAEMIDSGAISAERYAALQAALRGYRAP